MWPSRPIHAVVHRTFINFSLSFNVDSEKVPSPQIELIDLQYLEDLKSKFLSYYILPFGWFPNLITHTQQIVSIYGTVYHCKWLFSKMNHTKSMWCLQLLNLHLSDVLLLSTSLFNPDITSFFVIVDNIRYLINKLWWSFFEFSSPTTF